MLVRRRSEPGGRAWTMTVGGRAMLPRQTRRALESDDRSEGGTRTDGGGRVPPSLARRSFTCTGPKKRVIPAQPLVSWLQLVRLHSTSQHGTQQRSLQRRRRPPLHHRLVSLLACSCLPPWKPAGVRRLPLPGGACTPPARRWLPDRCATQSWVAAAHQCGYHLPCNGGGDPTLCAKPVSLERLSTVKPPPTQTTAPVHRHMRPSKERLEDLRGSILRLSAFRITLLTPFASSLAFSLPSPSPRAQLHPSPRARNAARVTRNQRLRHPHASLAGSPFPPLNAR